jgi:hypothetical protein
LGIESHSFQLRIGHYGDISTDGRAERIWTDNLLLGK